MNLIINIIHIKMRKNQIKIFNLLILANIITKNGIQVK